MCADRRTSRLTGLGGGEFRPAVLVVDGVGAHRQKSRSYRRAAAIWRTGTFLPRKPGVQSNVGGSVPERWHRGDCGPAEQQGPRFRARSPPRFVMGGCQRLVRGGDWPLRLETIGICSGEAFDAPSIALGVGRKAPGRSVLRAQASLSPRGLVPQKHIRGAGGGTARSAEGSADYRAHGTGASRPFRASALHSRDRARYRVSIPR